METTLIVLHHQEICIQLSEINTVMPCLSFGRGKLQRVQAI